MEKLTGQQLAETIADFVNTFSKDKNKEFVNGFCVQHRTLQQSSFRMMLQLIEHMATDEYKTDGRNEASKKIAMKLIDGFKKVIFEEELAMGRTPEEAKEHSESEYVQPSKFLPYI